MKKDKKRAEASFMKLSLLLLSASFSRVNSVVPNYILGSQYSLTRSVQTVSAISDINYQFTTNSAIQPGDCLIIEMSNPYSSFSSGELQQIRDNYKPFSANVATDCVLGTGFSTPACQLTSDSLTWKMTIPLNPNPIGSSITQIKGTLIKSINPFSLDSNFKILISYKENSCSTNTATNQRYFAWMDSLTPGYVPTMTLSVPAHPSPYGFVGKQDVPLTVQFTVGSYFPLNGLITMKFPPYYTHNTPSYTMVKGTFTLSQPSPVTAGPAITIQSGTQTYDSSIGTLSFKYLIQGTTTRYGYSGTDIQFIINGFNNPISQQAVSGFTIQISDTFGNLIDQTATFFTFSQLLQPATFQDMSVDLLDGSDVSTRVIAQKGRKIKLSFSLNFNVEPTCFFKVKFPREVMIDIDDEVSSYSGSGYGKNPGIVSKVPYQYDINYASTSTNSLIIQGCLNFNEWVSIDRDQGTLIISTVVSPGQQKDTGEFIINMYKDSGLQYQIATSVVSGGTTAMKIRSLTNLPVAMTLNYLQPIIDYTIEKTTDFKVSFIITKNLYSTSIIEIDLPNGVSVDMAVNCRIDYMSSNINSNAYCEYSNNPPNPSKVTIKNAFTSSSSDYWATDITGNPPSMEIIFFINTITNPSSTKQAGTWKVRTMNYLVSPVTSSDIPITVEEGQSLTSYEPQRGALYSILTGLTASTYQTSNLQQVYTFAIKFSNVVPVNGYLNFKFPTDFSLDTSSCQFQIYTTAPSQTTTPCSSYNTPCQLQSSSMCIKIQTNSLTKDTPYFIQIKGFKNPRSTKPTDFVEVISKTDLFDDINQGKVFFITMKDPDIVSWNYLSAKSSNSTNGAVNDYMFTIRSQSIAFVSQDILQIQMPNEVQLPGQVSCSASTGLSKVTCSNAGQRLILILDTINGGSSKGDLSFIVKGITNPSSKRPSSAVSLASVSDSNSNAVMSFNVITNQVKFTNQFPANILKYSLYQDNLALEVQATYRIEFVPTNKIGIDGAMIITWPSQVGIGNNVKVLVTTNQKRSPKIAINTGARTITITEITSGITGGYNGMVQVELYPVTNPRDNRVLNGFKIDTYDDTGLQYWIDTLKDNLLKPKTDCNYPCKTCLGSDMSFCLSCWADSSEVFLQSKDGGLQTCQTSCDQGRGFTTNGDKNKVCVKCDPTCKQCLDEGSIGDRSRCKECSDNSKYFYPASKKCTGSCENGFYESSRFTCSSCTQPCYQCSGTATTCTDCFKDSKLPFLYSQTCVNTCPSGFAGVQQACLKCQNPCDTCFNSTSQCLSCNQKGLQKYLFAFQCYENCPINTVADPVKMVCKGCMTGCNKCDTFNQTKCYECAAPLILFEYSCLTDCPGGYKRNSAGTGCDPSTIKDLTLVYFPFAIASFLLMILAVGGYFKDRKSIIISNMIILIGPVELLTACVQLFLTLVYSSVVVTGATGLSIVSYIVLNCIYTSKFNKQIAAVDTDYQFWMNYHQKTYKFINTLSRLFSFKMIRLNYSYLYGFDIFKTRFSNPEAVRALIRNYSIFHFVFSSLPILAIDVIILLQNLGILYLGLPSMSAIPTDVNKRLLASEDSGILQTISETAKNLAKQYGIDSQIKIVMLETLFLSLLMAFLTIWEFCKINRYMAFDYNEVEQESMAFLSQAENKEEKQMRREMLKKIMQQVKGNQELINENAHIQNTDLTHKFGKRRCQSMTTFDNEQEDDPREVRSEPPQPMPDWGDDGQERELTDNVYADSQPSDPLGKMGKKYIDADSQVTPEDFIKIISRKGDFVLLDGPENLSYRKKRGPNKRRGRKNQYYNQIDAEDDQEAENMETETMGDVGGATHTQMGLIREVDESPGAVKGSSGKKKQVKISEDKAAMDKQMKKIEEEKKKRDADELARKRKEEQEAKRLEDEIQQFDRQPTFGQQTKDPKVQVPPEANKRTFNENDILGEFDRDEKGNIILLQDKHGNFVDKLGRKVNERGYLINPQGDIIENQQQKTMFDKNDIDDRGEIPAPFCVEKHNFSPFKIRGEFDLDKNRYPIITKNRNGALVDKYGRMVNRKGWLIDKKGNVVDFMGVKKFDQRNLNPDNGDLPRLFNYNGQRYDINDICGAFDLNPHNGEIVLKTNAQGQHFDKFGRLVNAKGYLIDHHGHVVDKDGRKIFDKKYLASNGEVPKIFPFTKFNIQNIQGDFEMDPVGNPILERRPDGSFVDREGKRVNARGYYYDEHGNVIDKKGKIMFNKEILEQDGEIPEVFRSGLLKSDTASSLSRLMSEIERNQPEELYNNQTTGKKSRIYPGQGSGGDTSIDSMMDDTPSNYNQMNQRFGYAGSNGVIDEQDELRRKRKLKKKKKKGPVQEYTEPSDKDVQMAKAYGGVAKPQPKRVLPKGLKSPRSSISNTKGTLNKVAGSVAGFQRNHPSRRELEEQKGEILHHNQSHVILNETNDPSMMAVPEHHIREEKLKKQKMKELRLKGKLKKKRGGNPGDPDFEKMFGKDIDEFLEDSDWDIESFENMSQYSRGTAKSAFLDGRIRGLESIYLQRIESQMKKGGANPKSKRQQANKPKFRVMQDRFIDDPSQMVDNIDGGMSSQMSHQRNNRGLNNNSAMNPGAMRNMSVTAQTQFRPAHQQYDQSPQRQY